MLDLQLAVVLGAVAASGAPDLGDLQPSAARQMYRQIFAGGDLPLADVTVEDRHIDEFECGFKGMSEVEVSPGWLHMTAGVVVCQDHRAGAQVKGAFDDLAGVHTGLGECAPEHLIELNEVVLGIKEHDGKDLVR